MASVVDSTRNTLGDAFVSLPLLMMGFEFFYGTLTSNTGILYLLAGHFLLVPMLGYFTNTTKLSSLVKESPGTFGITLISSGLLIVFLANRFSVFLTNILPDDKKNMGTLGYILSAILLLLCFAAAYKGNPLADIFNPYRWFGPARSKFQMPPSCSILPVKEGESNLWSQPSLWTLHLLYLCGFLVANAVAVYNLPSPTLLGDDPETKDRKARLETRVNNRKRLAVIISLIVIVITSILLYIRYAKSGCETDFIGNFAVLLVVAFFGSQWYSLVEQYCGINPPDVLGIVSGLISPDLIDSPIVCVGEEGT